MPEEIGVLVDEEDRVVGTAPRSEIRARNLLHRGASVIVLDPNGRIFLHRRTQTKDVYPGALDVVAGGMVQAGESYEETARRELLEELGVDAEPVFRFTHRFRDDRNNGWMAVFEAVWDGPVTLQAEEVAWGDWVDIEDAVARTEREGFAPDHLAVFRRWLAERSDR